MAKNILGFIDKFGRRYDLPVRDNYDSLSEFCHPNQAGHHGLFSTTNYEDGSVTFDEAKNPHRAVTVIRGPLSLLALFEKSMITVDEIVLAVAELQHRINPVRS